MTKKVTKRILSIVYLATFEFLLSPVYFIRKMNIFLRRKLINVIRNDTALARRPHPRTASVSFWNFLHMG